ncbi:MAG: hypothetical protein AAF799_10915 [Myxococcota bacterium]
MAFEHEQTQALRILQGIEQGTLSTSQAYGLLVDADPALLHFIFTWLRAHYPPSHPASQGVVGRLVEICSTYPQIPRRVKEGASDPIVEWFEDAHRYRELQSQEFIALVIEKLEG